MNLRLMAAALLCTLSITANAAYTDYVDEVRVGLLDHDSSLIDSGREKGVDLNGEVLFHSPAWLDWAYSPRPNIGASINLRGKTDVLYFGLAWDVPVYGGFFLEPGFGIGFNDGELNSNQPDRRDMGCYYGFHSALSAGYKFVKNHSLMVTVEHTSNASLCESNSGISNIGVRYGFQF